MARIRTIKPEFWKHERLCALPEATHMLAAALLNYADDYGYFNANPKLIQGELFPLREPSVSIHDSLTALASIGYVRLGTTSDGRRVGHIVKFDEHQRVNRPTPSKISELGIMWDDSVSPHGILTEPSPPERNREQGKEQGTGNMRIVPDAPDDCVEAFALWNEMAERVGLPTASTLSDTRRSQMRLRLKEAGGLDGWRHALGKIEAEPFFRGENDKRWRADLDFVLKQSKFTKLMEGGYDRGKSRRDMTLEALEVMATGGRA